MKPLEMQIQSPSVLLSPVVVEVSWVPIGEWDHENPTQKHELRTYCRSHPESSDYRTIWLKPGDEPSWENVARDVAEDVWLGQIRTWHQRLEAAEQGVRDRNVTPLLVSPLEKEETKKTKKTK